MSSLYPENAQLRPGVLRRSREASDFLGLLEEPAILTVLFRVGRGIVEKLSEDLRRGDEVLDLGLPVRLDVLHSELLDVRRLVVRWQPDRHAPFEADRRPFRQPAQNPVVRLLGRPDP